MPLVGDISGSGGKASVIGITGSVIFAGADPDFGSSFPNVGTDVAFFVSGTVGSKDSGTNQGCSVFGGDLVTSGNLFLLNRNQFSHDRASGVSDTQMSRRGSFSLTTNDSISNGASGQTMTIVAPVLASDIVVTTTTTAGLFAHASAIANGNFQITLFNFTGGTVNDDATVVINWMAL